MISGAALVEGHGEFFMRYELMKVSLLTNTIDELNYIYSDSMV